MTSSKRRTADLENIQERLRQKRESYRRYKFNKEQHALLRTFFDLAQELNSLEDFFCICVVSPKEFWGVDSRLYLFDETGRQLKLVCDSLKGCAGKTQSVPSHIRLTSRSYEVDGSYVVPIHRKPAVDDIQPARKSKELAIGALEVFPGSKLSKSVRSFLRKYTNRIGSTLHNRMIAEQSIQHLKFINNLVMDIEHNVITPNIHFKHLINQLRKRIVDFDELVDMIQVMKQAEEGSNENCKIVLDKISALQQRLTQSHKELMDHHAHYSLFLETLFRRDHFAKGCLVLRPVKCLVEKEIIAPQLEHFARRLAARNIIVERPDDMRGEEIPLRVDVGLLSQVYANLFSNALKYTGEVIDHYGKPRKSMAYGREFLPDYFGLGTDGIKFNVFTTGQHLDAQEAAKIFTDGVRGENSHTLPGTGHGLSFIKQVIEIHGGEVGYERTGEGNNFYFFLPLSNTEDCGLFDN